MITCIKKGHKVTKHYGYYRTFMIWLSIFYLTSIKFCHYSWLHINLGDSPGGTLGKEFACQCRRLRDVGLIPGSGRSPGKGHGNPLKYSCLENPKDRGPWQATVHRVAQSWTRPKQLHTHSTNESWVSLVFIWSFYIPYFFTIF